MKPRRSNSAGGFISPQFTGKNYGLPLQDHDSYFSQTSTMSRALVMLQS